MLKKRIFVMCTGNSFRSQLAEGYLRRFCGEWADLFSAGVRASGKVGASSICLMAEEKVDISKHESPEQFLSRQCEVRNMIRDYFRTFVEENLGVAT